MVLILVYSSLSTCPTLLALLHFSVLYKKKKLIKGIILTPSMLVLSSTHSSSSETSLGKVCSVFLVKANSEFLNLSFTYRQQFFPTVHHLLSLKYFFSLGFQDAVLF